MGKSEFESVKTETTEEINKLEEMDQSFESSFKYHAVPLDQQITLDENGIPFTLQELMTLKEIKEEMDC